MMQSERNIKENNTLRETVSDTGMHFCRLQSSTFLALLLLMLLTTDKSVFQTKERDKVHFPFITFYSVVETIKKQDAILINLIKNILGSRKREDNLAKCVLCVCVLHANYTVCQVFCHSWLKT